MTASLTMTTPQAAPPPAALAPDRAAARRHVASLRADGGTYRSIAAAAGLAPVTVHALATGRAQTRPVTAAALLAITRQDIDGPRVDAGGTRFRLRALHVMGHGSARIARAAGASPAVIRRLVRGETSTVSTGLRDRVTAVYDAWWDKRAPDRTPAERSAATSARLRAIRGDWCAAAALDDDQLDTPGYEPGHGWRPASGTGTAGDLLAPEPAGHHRHVDRGRPGMTRPPHPEPTAWGTQRRLRALASRGWSPQAIESATGIPAGDVAAAISEQRTFDPDLGHQVLAAYNQLWNQQPPAATPRDRQLADTTRTAAERTGWPPPLAWDDDLIDQPHADPAPGWKPSRTKLRRSADLDEDMAWVREHGGYRHAPLSAVAARLGVTRAALEKARARTAGREAEPG